MASTTLPFKQAPHNVGTRVPLFSFDFHLNRAKSIPGPIEVADEVLYANAHPSMSHVSPDFIPFFGDCLRMIRQVVFAPNAQPFLISGSGTLGWDQVGANLVEPGDNALVLHSGYFGDSFADCLDTYGAKVQQLKAPIGGTVPLEDVAKELQQKKYKILTFTHVDTSTGVLSNAREIAALVRRVSPHTLVVMDAVCSVASEEILFDEWDLDVVLSASQKGLGAPPGLSILLASPRAMSVWEERKSRRKEGGYYVSWSKWLPIMKAYENGTAAYFATPPVNLIYAFHASLSLITTGSDPSTSSVPASASPTQLIQQRLQAHKVASQRIKDTATKLGLKQLPLNPKSEAANGMTALYYPEGVSAGDVLPKLGQKGVVVAGGLHVEIKDRYFRIGHMGVSVVDEERTDVDKVCKALEEVFAEIKKP